MIHGPTVGYGNGKKNQYRREVHAFVERALGPRNTNHVPRCDRRVLLLDEAEGIETFFLLSKGYRPENLHVVNFSAAKLAVLQSRVRGQTGHSINTYGVDLGRAVIERLPKLLDVLHLDFTSNCTDDVCLLIHHASHLIRDGGVIIVNMLKGRETSETLKLPAIHRYACRVAGLETSTLWWAWHSSKLGHPGDSITIQDFDRLRRIVNSVTTTTLAIAPHDLTIHGCRWHSIDFRHGKYQAGPSPMIWLALQVCSHRERDEQLIQDIYSVAAWMELQLNDPDESLCRSVLSCINLPPCMYNGMHEAMVSAVEIEKASRQRKENYLCRAIDLSLPQLRRLH